MASINVGKDPYPCFCGGSRTYEICETPSDYFFFKVPVPELVKKYPRYKTIVCDNCGNVQVLLIKSWQKYKYKYKYLANDPKYQELLTSLRTAYAEELNLKKDVTSYDDLIDSLQLALKGFQFK